MFLPCMCGPTGSTRLALQGLVEYYSTRVLQYSEQTRRFAGQIERGEVYFQQVCILSIERRKMLNAKSETGYF
jgi:hypothetical protein